MPLLKMDTFCVLLEDSPSKMSTMDNSYFQLMLGMAILLDLFGMEAKPYSIGTDEKCWMH
ncbi:Bgt-50601 [Blumeria graminis f. sp. tritici]|uniref:Bgt-50601 n=1 Tax=Blumeria graminis f. sp. tritici TaxID=62690 RepID=A0A9X9MHH9_BLUGR|nr:Bgt-50601 [Blumeria graminis f. sp. tritici]